MVESENDQVLWPYWLIIPLFKGFTDDIIVHLADVAVDPHREPVVIVAVHVVAQGQNVLDELAEGGTPPKVPDVA